MQIVKFFLQKHTLDFSLSHCYIVRDRENKYNNKTHSRYMSELAQNASKKQKIHDEHDHHGDHDSHDHDHSKQKRLPVTMLGGFLGAGSK